VGKTVLTWGINHSGEKRGINVCPTNLIDTYQERRIRLEYAKPNYRTLSKLGRANAACASLGAFKKKKKQVTTKETGTDRESESSKLLFRLRSVKTGGGKDD